MNSLSVFIQSERRVLVKADQFQCSWDEKLLLITVLCGFWAPSPPAANYGIKSLFYL